MPSIVTTAAGLVGAADLARLRALPHHPVHAAAVRVLASRPHTPDDSLMLLYSRPMDLRAYLMFQRVRDRLVVIEGMYSPYGGRGHGSCLLDALERRLPGGTTLALVSQPDSAAFFESRGFETPFRRTRLAGLGQLVMAKHIA